jgi:hypothetical protein
VSDRERSRLSRQESQPLSRDEIAQERHAQPKIVQLTVAMAHTPNTFLACYGKGRLHFNAFHLGHGWFEQGATERLDRLLIHEFGQQFSGDHLSEEYHEALCRLGAALKRLALENPNEFNQFIR